MKELLANSLDDIVEVLCGGRPSKTISREELKSLLGIVSLDFQVRPPSEEQVEVIYLLLTRNSQQQIGRYQPG